VLQSDGLEVSAVPATAFGLGLLTAEDSEASGLLTDAAPADIGGAAAVGTATEAARADHKHRLSDAIARHTATTAGRGPSDTDLVAGAMDDASLYGFGQRWRADNGALELVRRFNGVDQVLISVPMVVSGGQIHIGGPMSITGVGGGAVRIQLGTFANRLSINGAADGGSVNLAVIASVSGNGGLNFSSAGTGSITLSPGGVTGIRFIPVAGAVNYLAVSPSVTGVGVGIGPEGSDANIDLNLAAKGAGGVRIGTPTGGLGFFGGEPVAKATITGSRSTDTVAILTDLLQYLEDLNLIVDNTTA
jgi:hypothetical protein